MSDGPEFHGKDDTGHGMDERRAALKHARAGDKSKIACFACNICSRARYPPSSDCT